MSINNIIQNAIDFHVHIGPEIIPRKFTVPTLISYEKGKLAGIVLKNHFFPTATMGKESVDQQPMIIHSVVLNHYLGGLNADAIRASAELSSRPIVVWFPTIHAENFLQQQITEIPEEWIDPQRRDAVRLRAASEIQGISVLDSQGRLTTEAHQILKTIKEYNAILATGHLSWQESRILVTTAVQEYAIQNIIVTHPMYQKIQMPISIQRELADLGAKMEHSYSMYSIDGISIEKIAKQINAVGPKYCILSSDVGQAFSKSPSEALFEFASLLQQQGIEEADLETMLVTNTSQLINKKS